MSFNKLLLFFCLTLCLTSCVEVKQNVNIYIDGSGESRLEVVVEKQWSSLIIPKLKHNMPAGWDIVEEKQIAGKDVVVFQKKFKEISELSDDDARYTFTKQKEDFLKKSYSLVIEHLKTVNSPFPYEVTIKMPGDITETNGSKISSTEIRWNLMGFRRGTKLTVKSSAFLIPSAIGYTVLSFAGLLSVFLIIKVLKKSKAKASEYSSPSEKIFCTQCGRDNINSAAFCTNCGQRLK